MRLEALAVAQLVALLPALEDLRHDLGKYICFETRFVGLDAELETLRAAIVADLRTTRRQAADTLPAWDLWARLRPLALDDDPDLRAVDVAINELRETDLDGPLPVLLAAAEGAVRVQQATRRLHDRARSRLREAGVDPDEV